MNMVHIAECHLFSTCTHQPTAYGHLVPLKCWFLGYQAMLLLHFLTGIQQSKALLLNTGKLLQEHFVRHFFVLFPVLVYNNLKNGLSSCIQRLSHCLRFLSVLPNGGFQAYCRLLLCLCGLCAVCFLCLGQMPASQVDVQGASCFSRFYTVKHLGILPCCVVVLLFAPGISASSFQNAQSLGALLFAQSLRLHTVPHSRLLASKSLFDSCSNTY